MTYAIEYLKAKRDEIRDVIKQKAYKDQEDLDYCLDAELSLNKALLKLTSHAEIILDLVPKAHQKKTAFELYQYMDKNPNKDWVKRINNIFKN